MVPGARASRRTVLFAIVTAAAGSVVVGCASSGAAAPSATKPPAQAGSDTTTKAAESSGSTVVVTMNDQFRYVPETITIAKGTTVEWKNTSASPHTVTDDPSKAQNKANAVLPSGAEPWDSEMIDPGKSYTHTFTVAGDYTYFCIPHESLGMVGKIKVT